MNKPTWIIHLYGLAVIAVFTGLAWFAYPPDSTLASRAIMLGISLLLGGSIFLVSSPQTRMQRALNRDLTDEKVPWIIYLMPPIATVIMNSLFERSTQYYIGFTVCLTFIWFFSFNFVYRLYNGMKQKQ